MMWHILRTSYCLLLITFTQWGKIIHPFSNFNGYTVEFGELMINFIPHFRIYGIISPCCDWNESMSVEVAVVITYLWTNSLGGGGRGVQSLLNTLYSCWSEMLHPDFLQIITSQLLCIVYTLRSRQYGRHLAGSIFKFIFINETFACSYESNWK